MLKPTSQSKTRTTGGTYALVASRYNARYVDAMVRGARRTLEEAGGTVRVVRVPGAFEIPAAAAKLLSSGQPPCSAVICLGVILQGETEHARLIAEAVTQSLARLQVERLVPVVHEVLLLANRQQAEVRCRDARTNRGVEAAQTALAMRALFRRL